MTPPQASAPQPRGRAGGIGPNIGSDIGSTDPHAGRDTGPDTVQDAGPDHGPGGAVRVACGAEIELALVTGPTTEIPFPARLTYTQADPYAVRLHCQTGPRTTVTWVLSRETLRRGLERPSGLGDVHVRPATHPWPGPAAGIGVAPDGRETVLITLGTGADAALLRGDSAAVRRFLDLSAAVVTPGTEHRHLDLDALIALLRQAP